MRYERLIVTWVWKGKGKEIGRRFDHVFASSGLDSESYRYLHEWREDGLSDHSAIEVVFSPESIGADASSESGAKRTI